MIAFSSTPITTEDYSFATKIGSNKLKENQTTVQLFESEYQKFDLEEQNGFMVIYEQLDYCCQETYPCVVINSDELENANVLCVCSSNTFQPNSCSSNGKKTES